MYRLFTDSHYIQMYIYLHHQMIDKSVWHGMVATRNINIVTEYRKINYK